MSSKHDSPPPEGVDPSICPLCGRPNGCAWAVGGRECWCETATIPSEVLFRVPKHARGHACVCRECAESAGESEG